MPTFAETCASLAIEAQIAKKEKLVTNFNNEVVHEINAQIKNIASDGGRAYEIGSFYKDYFPLIISVYETPTMGFKCTLHDKNLLIISW
jgi:hypothetical protein